MEVNNMVFEHLRIPSHWEHYWTKYPEGYTILEALLNWVNQTNGMIDNVNQWNEYLDEFVKSFDSELQETVIKIVREWQETGELEVIISEALQTEIDTVEQLLLDKTPYLSLDQYEAYKLLHSSGDYDYAPAMIKLIEDLPEDGGEIVIPNKTFGIYSDVTINKTLSIRGMGYSSILRGSGTIQTDSDITHTLTMQNLKLVNTDTNTLLKISKDWTSSSSPTFELSKVWFHSESGEGVLLDVYGARESGIENCWFTSINVTDKNTTGISLRANESGGAMNIDITGCKFLRLKTAIHAEATRGYYYHLAGLRMVNNMMIGLSEGLKVIDADYLIFEQSMMDYVVTPIYIDHVVNAKIRHNYLAGNGEDIDIVSVNMSLSDKEMHWLDVSNNRIFSYATSKGNGIVVNGSAGDIAYGSIAFNNMDLLDNGIVLKGSNGGRTMHLKVSNNIGRAMNSLILIESGAENNEITDNFGQSDITTLIVDNVGSGYGNRQRNGNIHGVKRSNNRGKLIASGDGSTTVFTANHNLYKAPETALASVGTSAIRDIPYTVQYDTSTIIFTFKTAPTSGTNNIVINWEASI